jgi:hypothetical protein
MKYLILLSLLCTTSSIFAKDFDASLLLGTWQCHSQSQDKEMKSSENTILEYYQNGTYKTKTQIKYSYRGQNDTVKAVLKGRWKIEGEHYFYTVDKVLHFSAKNKSLAEELNLEQFLQTDNEFLKDNIVELSEHTLSFRLTDEDAELLQATANSNCHRINKK